LAPIWGNKMRDEFLIEYRDHYITCFYTYDNLRRYAVIFKDKITLTLIEAQAIIDEHIAKQEANS
jgi:hypothetical protein